MPLPRCWSAEPAKADFRLCNNTSSRIGIAVGYKENETWTTEGWWNIAARSCETILRGGLVARFYYIYAVDYDRGGEWSGQAYMCSREKEFTIKGTEDCLARGFDRTGYFEVDTGDQPSWTVQLTESADQAPMHAVAIARAAGADHAARRRPATHRRSRSAAATTSGTEQSADQRSTRSVTLPRERSEWWGGSAIASEPGWGAVALCHATPPTHATDGPPPRPSPPFAPLTGGGEPQARATPGHSIPRKMQYEGAMIHRTDSALMRRLRRTKIVATLGPGVLRSSRDREACSRPAPTSSAST